MYSLSIPETESALSSLIQLYASFPIYFQLYIVAKLPNLIMLSVLVVAVLFLSFPLSATFSVPLRFPWFRCRDMIYFDVLKLKFNFNSTLKPPSNKSWPHCYTRAGYQNLMLKRRYHYLLNNNCKESDLCVIPVQDISFFSVNTNLKSIPIFALNYIFACWIIQDRDQIYITMFDKQGKEIMYTEDWFSKNFK